MNRRKRGNSIHSKSKQSRSSNKSPQKSFFYQNQKKINASPSKVQLFETFFDKIVKLYSTHTRLGEKFEIRFSFLRPQNGLDNLNSIPDIINFRFSFWDFEEFYTVPGILSKPKEYKINHLLTSPILPIVKFNLIDYYTQEDSQELIAEINYDPSINNFINYKTFLSYLAFREIFIEIYDYEKQIPYGYTKLPLVKFLRSSGARFSKEEIELDIYDNFTYEKKGSLGLSLKSEEMNTKNNFNIVEQNIKLNLIDAGQKDINNKNKQIACVGAKKRDFFQNFMNEEEKNYNQNINKIKLSVINNKTFISQTNNLNNNINENYDYNQQKENKINTTIMDFNKKNNELTLSLIQGEPHYFNYIIHNNSDSEQKYYVVISTDENKYSNNKRNDIILSLVSNSEEYEYATMIKNLKVPNNYHSVSENEYFILGPQKSLPLLFKCLSYKSFSGLENNFQIIHSIIIYDIKGYPQYNLIVKVLKVFPIIDFEYYYMIPKGKNEKIVFLNPYKNMTVIKSKQLLSNYIFLNGIDYKNYIPEIKMDQQTNDFYFIFNNNLDYTNNSKDNIYLKDIENSFNQSYHFQKTIDNYNDKKLLFLYKDKFRAQLLVTFSFIINSYEFINISYNLGAKMKKSLSFSFIGNENKRIKFCSSDNNAIIFDDEYKNGIIINPNKMYQIDFYVYIKKLQNYKIMVNCLDMDNKEIFKSWIINAIAGQFNIIQKIDIDYIIKSSNEVKTSFEFTNPLNSFSVINFICSTKTVIDIPINQINFDSKETRNIIINVRKILIPQKITAYIFIMDTNNFFHDVVEVNINYI